MSAREINLSDHSKSLSESDKARYLEKLELLNIDCPYLIPKELRKYERDVIGLCPPKMTERDIVTYLLFRRDFLSHEEYEAFKSLQSHKLAENGWVQDFCLLKLQNGVALVKANVYHSQALSLPPLQPWAAVNSTGFIICCHCDCKAGTGEVCSHVGGLLYQLISYSGKQTGAVCTSQPNVWLKPTKRPERLKKVANLKSTGQLRPRYNLSKIMPPSDDEVADTFRRLSEEPNKSIVLSVVPGYAELFKPVELPPSLSSLYDKSLVGKPIDVIKSACEELVPLTKRTKEQLDQVELFTREQSKVSAWYTQRAGRCTASKAKQLLQVDVLNPSRTFVQSICYPQPSSFKRQLKAISWGLRKESWALRELKRRIMEDGSHVDFQIERVGLIVSEEHQFLAASPDANFTCSCHGKGVVEVKCPYKYRESSIARAVRTDPGFPLQESISNTSSRYVMNPTHAYYYQIQHQLCVTKRDFAIFVVYTSIDFAYILVDRNAAICSDIIAKGKLVFFINRSTRVGRSSFHHFGVPREAEIIRFKLPALYVPKRFQRGYDHLFPKGLSY